MFRKAVVERAEIEGGFVSMCDIECLNSNQPRHPTHNKPGVRVKPAPLRLKCLGKAAWAVIPGDPV
ncbi:MAG: hypothetical protein ACTSRN_08900 [Alphaproteobacteria bacterium]